MGKADNHRLPVVQQSHGTSASRTFLYQRCAMGFYRLLSFKCAVVLILSVAAFLSAFFWALPIRYRQSGFDAKDSIKLSATVQSYFKLEKPVYELVPYVARLEYDINDEIGVPSSKVVVLSMHQAGLPNRTNVVFGFLPDPINSTMNVVALSLLRPLLTDLFLQQYNLTLTSPIFGEPSSFEILKFPGGITIIPEQAALISQPLVNFTLNSSIYDIKENLSELKDQLKLGLRLMPNEVVNHIAREINTAGSDNYWISFYGKSRLDHSVFGKVKEISLSSFLNHSLYAPAPAPTPTPTPTPSPSPSPEWIYDTGPSMAPSYHSLPPCSNCYTSEPSGSSHPSAPSPQNVPYPSLSPSVAHGSPHCSSTNPLSPSPSSHPEQMSPNLSPQAVLTPQSSPSLSPIPGVAYGSQGPDERSRKGLVPPLHVSSVRFVNAHSFLVAESVKSVDRLKSPQEVKKSLEVKAKRWQALFSERANCKMYGFFLIICKEGEAQMRRDLC
ncbi:hypothetical protein DH2020_034370 [Rehmannia glutinosa]|uniref:DUF7036 domain-containing protein n=1 Tax=Rehmannia glutinosa TaxID=99300 RepID=A0ABR0V9I8_REHGL